jgi:DNA-binding response OmpR family regulator
MAEKLVILAVDSNPHNVKLLAQYLGREGYETLGASSLAEIDHAIQGEEKIALGLIDLSGFDQSIWERCEQLRKAGTPFIVISPQRSPAVQRDSMKHGASGLMVKPLGIKDMMEYIHTLLGD